MSRQRKTIGQRRLPSGNWQVFAKVQGVFYQQVFPATSTVGERNAWRDKTIADHGGVKADAGSLAADVEKFLAKPDIATIGGYAGLLAHWIAALGPHRPRRQMTRDDYEAVLQGWLKTCSPVTVYHRRTALSRLYTVLDGPDAPNPIKQTTRPAHWRPQLRSVPFDTIVQVLAAMPDTRVIGKGLRGPSLGKLRLTVIAHTGIPAAELLKLRRHHFDRAGRFLWMPWRDKGAGTPAHRRELSDAGFAAVDALDAANGWGHFAIKSLGRSFKRSARRVLGAATPVSVYWLRHSLGSDAYASTRDLETVRRLLGHAEGSQATRQYAAAANADVDRAGLAALSAYRAAALGQPSAPPSRPQLHARLHGDRKQQKSKALRKAG